MASNIVPAFPLAGTPTTVTVRANFLAARDEIGALQASLSPNGFHLTADDTAGLGAALGGDQDGRIAFDTDKGVIVRDTLAASPNPAYWMDLALRPVPYGDTASRPAAGSITDGDFVEFYWNTDTTMFQMDNGAAWIDIGPSGGGSGPLLTEDVEPIFSTGFQSVTHPAVPLTGVGSGAIRFSVLANLSGTSHTDLPQYTVTENLQMAALNWISDSATGGHFDGAPDPRVTSNCWVTIGGVGHTIVTFTPPGTGFDQVILEASVPSNTVSIIQSVYTYGFTVETTLFYDGTYHYSFSNSVSWCMESADNIISPAEVTTMGRINGIRGYVLYNGVRKFTGSSGLGTFNQGNFIYVGASWGAATKTGEILKVMGTAAAPVIWYRLLTGSDFALSDAIVEWDGALDGATCTCGTPDIASLGRMAVTLDGATWQVFNGSAWVPMLITNLETEGMEIPGGVSASNIRDTNGAVIPDDDGTLFPPEGWGTLRTAMVMAGGGLHFRLLVGVRGGAENIGGSVYSVSLDWSEPDYTTTMLIGTAFSDFKVERVSTTSARFTRVTGTDTIRQVHFQVWT